MVFWRSLKIHISNVGFECDFTIGFCRFGDQRTFPTDHGMPKFGVLGGWDAARGYQDWRIRGFEGNWLYIL